MAPVLTIVFALLIVAITVARIILRAHDPFAKYWWSAFIIFSVLTILIMLALIASTIVEIYERH